MSAQPLSSNVDYAGGDLLLRQQQSLDEIMRIASATPRLSYDPRSSSDRTIEEDLQHQDLSVPSEKFWTKSAIISVSIACGVGIVIGVPLGYLTY